MGRFRLFATLYATAVILETTESWRDPLFTAGLVLFTAVWVFSGFTRLSFAVFLGATTIYFVGFRFPEVANHVNFIVCCNVMMLTGMALARARPALYRTDDDYFELISPVLRVSLIVVYAVAGFHKLNADFFNPAVSCTRDIVSNLNTSGHQIPAPEVIVAGAGAVALLFGWAVKNRALDFRRASVGSMLAVGAGVAVVGGLGVAGMLWLGAGSNLPGGIKDILIQTASVWVVFWEIVLALLLVVRRAQGPILLCCWLTHASLAMVAFVDFSSLALAFLFTYVPESWVPALNSRVGLPLLPRPIHRLHLYFAVNVLLVGTALGIHHAIVPWLTHPRGLAGGLWNLTTLVFLWPIVTHLWRSEKRPRWSGLPIAGRGFSPVLVMFPLLLVIWAWQPYFGLRTAGVFSMFSNLRTEGATSNHFILGGNPLKIWGYQEDAIQVIEIDDRRARIGHQWRNLKGNRLPVVEFRKRIREWTRRGTPVPMKFAYEGTSYDTPDVTTDPRWQVDRRDREMRLLDFRVIQGEGPVSCRW